MMADTSFIIDVMRNDPSAVKKAKEIESRGGFITVGAPTVFELYVGLSLTKKPAEEQIRIKDVLTALPQLPLDSEGAAFGGIIYGEKIKAGSAMDPEDAMIAGIAKTNNKKILTRNLKHFQGIEGLITESY